MIDEIRTTRNGEKVRVTFRWWVKAYLWALMFFAWLMQREVDYDKAADVMMAGAKIEVEE